MLWVGVSVGVVTLLVAGGVAARWMMHRPLFEPGSVEARIAARSESFDPPASSASEVAAWQVTPEIALHHFSLGAGEDVLVVHGGPGIPPAKPWRAAELSEDEFRWHFYHQRGAGRSTRPVIRPPAGGTWEAMQELEGELGLAQQIADIERIRRLLGKERILLVGHSFGALIAALYAAEWPDRVAALVLIAPAPLLTMPVEDGDLFSLVRERLPDDHRAAYDAYTENYFDFPKLMRRSDADLAAFFGEISRYYRIAAGPGAAPVESADPGGFVTLANYLSLGRRHDWTAWMSRVSAPVLVVHGSADLQSRAASERVASAFPNVRFEEVQGGTHFLYQDRAEALVELMRSAVTDMRK